MTQSDLNPTPSSLGVRWTRAQVKQRGKVTRCDNEWKLMVAHEIWVLMLCRRTTLPHNLNKWSVVWQFQSREHIGQYLVTSLNLFPTSNCGYRGHGSNGRPIYYPHFSCRNQIWGSLACIRHQKCKATFADTIQLHEKRNNHQFKIVTTEVTTRPFICIKSNKLHYKLDFQHPMHT